MLGIRNVLVHSPLSMLENVARSTGDDVMTVQRPVDKTILAHLKVSRVEQEPEDKVRTDSDPVSVGSTQAAGKDREDGVAEFKGPVIHGLVRFAQVNTEEARIEAEFDGLSPGGIHKWSVNEYGDLREGAATTGSPYSPFPVNSLVPTVEEAAGILGTLTADCSGHAKFVGRSARLPVWDVIGRSVVLYGSSSDDQEDACRVDAIAAAVIARSSVSVSTGGAANRLCACDGTLVWQSTR